MSDIVVTFLLLVVVVIVVVAVVLKMLMPKKVSGLFLKNQRSNLRRASSEATSEPIEAAISEVVHDTYDNDVATDVSKEANVAEQLTKLSKLRDGGSLTDEEFGFLKAKLIRGEDPHSRSQNSYDEPADLEERVGSLLGNNSNRGKGWGSATKEVFLRLGLPVLLVSFGASAFFLLISSSTDLGLAVTKSEGGAKGEVLTISNRGKAKIEIQDITINDRDDCTMVGMDFVFAALSEDGEFKKLKAELQDASKRDPLLLHNMWFTYKTNSMTAVVIGSALGNNLQSKGRILLPKMLANRKFVLDVGDRESWQQGCGIIRATVKTDRGTQTYTLN